MALQGRAHSAALCSERACPGKGTQAKRRWLAEGGEKLRECELELSRTRMWAPHHGISRPILQAAAKEAAGAGEIAGLQASAAERMAVFEETSDQPEEAAASIVDNSRRAFYKDFTKVWPAFGAPHCTIFLCRATTHLYSCTPQVIEASDVILEVVDARDPLGCRCTDVERFIRKVDPSKRIVILLNKVGESSGVSPPRVAHHRSASVC